jgi:hypothetical protein
MMPRLSWCSAVFFNARIAVNNGVYVLRWLGCLSSVGTNSKA